MLHLIKPNVVLSLKLPPSFSYYILASSCCCFSGVYSEGISAVEGGEEAERG